MYTALGMCNDVMMFSAVRHASADLVTRSMMRSRHRRSSSSTSLSWWRPERRLRESTEQQVKASFEVKVSLEKLTRLRNKVIFTWFISVERLDPSRMFFSRIFNSFTSLSVGIWALEEKTNRMRYIARVDVTKIKMDFFFFTLWDFCALYKCTLYKPFIIEMHRLKFSWPILIFADSDFLSKNYNWQHIQTKIYTFLMQKNYLHNKKNINHYNSPNLDKVIDVISLKQLKIKFSVTRKEVEIIINWKGVAVLFKKTDVISHCFLNRLA